MTWNEKILLEEPEADCDIAVAVKAGVVKLHSATMSSHRPSQDSQLIRLVLSEQQENNRK